MDDVEVDTQNAGGSGGGIGYGASSMPIPLARDQHQRRTDKYVLKFSGTTWVDAANNGTNNNVWSKFPWEFVNVWMGGVTAQEIRSSHLYWKATHVHVQFKNPQCVQNIGNPTTGVVQSGVNTQAQLFGYLDNMYMAGIDTEPGTGPSATPPTHAQMTTLVDSFDTHGYQGGVPVLLPATQVNQSTFTSSTPDCKEMGMGGGQSIDFGWNIHSPYWRPTAEFSAVSNGTASARWDEYMGYVGSYAPIGAGAVPAAANYNVIDYSDVNNPALTAETYANIQPIPGAVTTVGLLSSYPYMNPDPIPGLYVQLQPQLSSITVGTGTSICQLQFEIEVELLLSGRIPRMTTNIYGGVQGVSNTTSATGPFVHFNRIPLFRPLCVEQAQPSVYSDIQAQKDKEHEQELTDLLSN